QEFGDAGRRRAKGRSGNTDEPFDEPAAEKTASLRVAIWRAPATSQGSTDGHRIALRLASCGSPRRTATPAVSSQENQALGRRLAGGVYQQAHELLHLAAVDPAHHRHDVVLIVHEDDVGAVADEGDAVGPCRRI